ncbi:MAG: bifunctional alpha,alpha-trehalose-phosphate synthase (UDP-forming)/trehalose-phosphatase [Thermosulfidibacteraceae bacterium]|jgi:trehalose 6-phosphate synthase/phosphatase
MISYNGGNFEGKENEILHNVGEFVEDLSLEGFTFRRGTLPSLKVLLVSNRLPFSIGSDLTFSKSPGGLASGVETFLKKADFIDDYLWIGWPGRHLDRKTLDLLRPKFKRHKVVPVDIPQKYLDKFYNGFCNRTLWPLFHSFTGYVVYDDSYWESYRIVNEIFFKEVSKYVDDSSFIWIHDYHLMLLPSMLREQFPNASIGFFLHIPFPPPEVFMQLPWKGEIFRGLLGCDLIGFHIHEYTSNFLRTLTRLWGIDHRMGNFEYEGRLIRVDTFPMGIDFDLFSSAYKMRRVQRYFREINKSLKGKRIIFSADRLDYTKGIYNRLLAFEGLLLKRPDLHGKIVLIMVVVPSREGVEHYQRMKKQLEEKISEINGRFGKLDWIPVIYYYRLLGFEELVAHYLASNVMLVTPLKDGMNLMAKEFVASRSDLKGVLILSEFAGSARELGEAVLVNPNSINELTNALEEALELPESEQSIRLMSMRDRLKRYDVVKWGREFLNTLSLLRNEKIKLETKGLEHHFGDIVTRFHSASQRILFLDYDGTLVPIAPRPHIAAPDREVRELLNNLVLNEGTDVVIISGRKKEDLETWFSGIMVTLVAEHGLFVKEPDEDWRLLFSVSSDLKEAIKHIRNVMEIYVDRLPYSFIEEKDYSISFHYRTSDLELAKLRIPELIDELLILIRNMQVNLIFGRKVIEVRPAGTGKGIAAQYFLGRRDYDFILAAGDDATDEELFRSLPEDAVTIKVGLERSHAKFSTKSYRELRRLLENFVSGRV